MTATRQDFPGAMAGAPVRPVSTGRFLHVFQIREGLAARLDIEREDLRTA